MKFLAAAIVILPLLLTGAPPALAQATGGAQSTDRESYTKQAEGEMQDWKQKIEKGGAKTEAAGKEAGASANRQLNTAWSKTQNASRKLKNVGDEGWEQAKLGYERAKRNLANTWHKVHPNE